MSNQPEEVQEVKEVLKNPNRSNWYLLRLYDDYKERQYDEIVYKAQRLSTTPISLMYHEESKSVNFCLKLLSIGTLLVLTTLQKKNN